MQIFHTYLFVSNNAHQFLFGCNNILTKFFTGHYGSRQSKSGQNPLNVYFVTFPKTKYVMSHRYVEVTTITFFLSFCSINVSKCTKLLNSRNFEESFQNIAMKV